IVDFFEIIFNPAYYLALTLKTNLGVYRFIPIWHQSPKLTPRYFLETPRLFGYPGVRNVIAKKAGQRFEVDVVQKMLIPKIAIKDKLQ
ncbi:hypothetical protein, partial [Holdemanella sp. MSK.7.32]|uniref:hypothetical protein n=1 Tax=Holdemanella sp. MSK.7.32 TaxID=2965273 RepID=UPI00210B63D7